MRLEEMIEDACNPARFESDARLNKEICDRINQKQGSLPRIAAMRIVRLVNSKHVHQGMLALTLLDMCVKHCGYPFHLQIATKEFLNALVRKFPERPPTRTLVPDTPNGWNHFDIVPSASQMNPIMERILYMIKQWKVALAELSRYKEDLVHIKDMYRLLRSKGYRFPELRASSVNELTPPETLRTPEEIEEEERVAQAAKLQELIRRGRPQDLAEANHLMKIMTGYNQQQQPDYKEKFTGELRKIRNKAQLLYDMLEKVKPGQKVDVNDMMTFKYTCETTLPRIATMIKQENDVERLEDLLTVNDILQNVMAKYFDLKKGIYDTHYSVDSKPTKPPKEDAPAQAISLIDLDDNTLTSPVQDQSRQNASSDISVFDELSNVFEQQVQVTTSYFPPVSKNGDLMHNSGTSPLPMMSPVSTVDSPDSNMTQTTRYGKEDEKIILLDKNGLQIVLKGSVQDSIYRLTAYFSNRSTVPMERMVLHMATPKSMTLAMENPSAQVIPSKSEAVVTQNLTLENPQRCPLRLKYKVTYEQFGVEMEQSGIYEES
ncbi:uncharacterized protein BYT42DRAFT_288822 [Radiomyces spectabilis]|uniref:uncharacterized protein n=1 Tax=Radiomyces spectabilis TaxID=64574 RepID=UPI00221FB89C|nr:uncharacterized protein BYT42DRAFT_288822 [Radiomyces spectabilis]KAI8381013.1 hypothetical protein BYT42DRAFT_288822 [Radiomyces spectabilis]